MKPLASLGIIILFSISLIAQTDLEKFLPQNELKSNLLDVNGIPIQQIKNDKASKSNSNSEQVFGVLGTISSIDFEFDSVRAISELNEPNLAEAYPWISNDGLRLYYTDSNSTSWQIVMSERVHVDSLFQEPTSLSINSTLNNTFSGWLTDDELNIYFIRTLDEIIDDTFTELYHASRTNINDDFNPPSLVDLPPNVDGFFSGPSLTKDLEELYLYQTDMSSNFSQIIVLERVNTNEYSTVGNLCIPTGYLPNPGILAAEDLKYYFALHEENTPEISSFYVLERESINDDFDSIYYLDNPLINDLNWNGQPTISNNERYYAFTRADGFSWSGNNLMIAQSLTPEDEICDNGIDDDGDGLIDCEDPDCFGNECITCLESEISFADALIAYEPNCFDELADERKDPLEALGIADYDPSAAPLGSGGVSLGDGGSITLQFTDNLLTNSGSASPDLWIFEIGTDIEASFIELRPDDQATIDALTTEGILDVDGDGFYPLGSIGGSISFVDIDGIIMNYAAGLLVFDAVRIIDDINDNNFGCVEYAGADIDAICALSTIPNTMEICDNGIDDDGDGDIDCDDEELANDCCCFETPNFEIEPEYFVCTGDTITIDAGMDFMSYTWSNASGVLTNVSSLTTSIPGIYFLTGVDMCDNVVTDSIEIFELIDQLIETVNFEICQGDSVIINDIKYFVSGQFEQNLETVNACDSILIVSVIVNPNIEIERDITICDNEFIEIDGTIYTDAGEYEFSYLDSNGCDSTELIRLTVFPTFESFESHIINEGDNITINGEDFDMAGDYEQSLTAANGCDSLVNIQIIVLPSEDPEVIVHFGLNACQANNDYADFPPTYPNELSCASLSSSTFQNNYDYGHSCTEGVNGTGAMCISSYNSCTYDANNPQRIEFTVQIDVDPNTKVIIDQFNFYEAAPEEFSWANGVSGSNNYPTLYGLRILSDGIEIFSQTSNPTSTNWSLETFDFTNNANFSFSSSTELTFELLPYCLVGNNSTSVAAWDLDEISLSGHCAIEGNTINGTVQNRLNNNPMEAVLLTLNDGENELETFTNANGIFAFNPLTAEENYNIKAFKNDDPLNGVSTLDLILMQKHLLGIKPFENFTSFIAADINNSQSVSAIDLIELRKLILGIYSTFPRNTSWRFIDKNEPIESPWSIHETINIEANKNDVAQFTGIKIGDINNSNKQFHVSVETRNDTDILLDYTIENVKNTKLALIHFSADQEMDLQGLQLSIDLKGGALNSIFSPSLNINSTNFFVKGDNINISWNDQIQTLEKGQILFSLEINTVESDKLEVSLSLKSIANQFYLNTELDVQNVSLKHNESSQEALEKMTWKIFPNPLQSNSRLEINVSKDQNLSIEILNQNGQLVKNWNENIFTGTNSIKIDPNNLPLNSGIYLVRISSEDFSSTKKIWILN